VSDMSKIKAIVNIEGIDGVGKETVALKLREALYPNAYYSTFPNYSTESGKTVRDMLNGVYGDPTKIDPKLMGMPLTIDRRIEYNAMADYFDNLCPHPENIYYICNRSWLSNLFYQGTKVYFKPVFDSIRKDSINQVHIVRTMKEAYDLIEQMRGVVIAKVAIVILPATFRDVPIVLEGYGNLSQSFKMKKLDTKFHNSSKELDDYINWLYQREIVGTPIEGNKFYNIYLTRHGTFDSIIKTITQKIHETRDHADLVESNNSYLGLVNAFSYMLMYDLIPNLNWMDTIPALEDGFHVNYQQTGSTPEEIDKISDRTVQDILELIGAKPIGG